MRRYNLIFRAFTNASRAGYNRPLTSAVWQPFIATTRQLTILTSNTERRSYSQTRPKCWSCQTELPSDLCVEYTCVNCHSLQSVPKQCDHFQLLGLQRQFGIDLSDLQKRFRAIQGILHPDKFSNKSEQEQTLSAEWSSLINNAYKTLHSPIRRGEYLLQLHGVTIPEGNSEVNPEFLMEMMERNEEVDDADGADELKQLLDKVRDDMAKCADTLGASLEAQRLDDARTNLITFRYFVSLENSIKEKSNRLGIHL